MNRRTGVTLVVALTSSLAAVGLNVGTAAAADPQPYMVENIRPGGRSSNPTDLTAIGNLLYFTASDGKHGREPWVSDGTPSGTHLIKNISPGSYSSNASDYTQVGSKVFFTAQDGSGRELWKTDGTAAGTVRVKDIRPGNKSSKPTELTAVGNMLFLSANDGPHGQELWKSDGTEAGTVMVSDLQPGKLGSIPSELTSYANRLYFTRVVYANTTPPFPCCVLLRSDGTNAGTQTVLDKDGEWIIGASQLTKSGSLLFFTAAQNTYDSHLWRTDGTKVGTRAISGDIRPENLTDVSGRIFFTVEGSELWKSDGTSASTALIKQVDNPSQLTASGNHLFYMTLNDAEEQCLRVSDGVDRGFDAGSCAYWYNGYAWGNLTNVGGTLYLTFGSNDQPSHQLGWALYYVDCSLSNDCSEGAPTQRVVPSGQPMTFEDQRLTDVGGKLFFAARDPNNSFGVELWTYAPSAATGS